MVISSPPIYFPLALEKCLMKRQIPLFFFLESLAIRFKIAQKIRNNYNAKFCWKTSAENWNSEFKV